MTCKENRTAHELSNPEIYSQLLVSSLVIWVRQSQSHNINDTHHFAFVNVSSEWRAHINIYPRLTKVISFFVFFFSFKDKEKCLSVNSKCFYSYTLTFSWTLLELKGLGVMQTFSHADFRANRPCIRIDSNFAQLSLLWIGRCLWD